eukprot:8927464-Pyramimonas_sp.AAC.1
MPQGQVSQELLSRGWETFVAAAERQWVDVYQVSSDDARKMRGRDRPAQPKWVESIPPMPPKFPRVSPAVLWLRSLGAAL